MMDSAVIAAIVSVLGAGFLAMLFFFMRGIRADIADLRSEIRSLRTEMQAESAALRAEIAAVRAEMHGMRSDISGLQQTVARHDGILSQIGLRNGTAD